MNKLKKIFTAGIIFIIPISLSIWILFRIMCFFENILGTFLKKSIPTVYIPGLGFIVLIILIFLIGLLANNFFGKKLLLIFEKIVSTMPLLNKIYIFIKGTSHSLLREEGNIFKEVVKVEFFSGAYTIGFITGKSNLKKYVSVFVPTVPNISTGFYLLIPENKIEKLDISVEEALKTVVSMGVFGHKNGSNEDKSNSFEEE